MVFFFCLSLSDKYKKPTPITTTNNSDSQDKIPPQPLNHGHHFTKTPTTINPQTDQQF